MRALSANLAIAFLWMAVTGAWSGAGLAAGMAIGVALLSLLPPRSGRLRYGVKLYRVLKLLAVFLREFALSVLRVAAQVLSPRMNIVPRFFRFPLTVTSDFEITLLANMITLTPGTLTVDVADDRRTLLVHAIDCPDPEAAKRDISNGFERLIREAFSP
jgi:multicomponent Na+:H+ antiporter subunit E